MTTGQQFAKDMQKNLSIGTRTRRWSGKPPDSDMHELILKSIAHAQATLRDGGHSKTRTELVRSAFWAMCSYEKHIWNGRATPVLVAYLNDQTPWQLCNLLGQMIDAKISNVGEGERFFSQYFVRNRDQIDAWLK
ncbi:hypothetical protein ACIQVN_22530 [Streptomyces cyaneofuscatus]|uniref:hypothetical protein n=1 Tax=Streptomyces cyaneofuscatus TaxID=66883 RepID=UPI0038017CFB